MGKEPLYGWNWGQAFLDEETLEKYSTIQLQKRLKENRKKINHTMKYIFNYEWEHGGFDSRINSKMEMVEDLLEYCHRIEGVLEKRGYRARSVRESLEFERGNDPKSSLNIGRNRKIKKGDRFEVEYKDKKYIVTALDDEEEKNVRTCVRSGGPGRDAEYETRTIKEVHFMDDEGDICYAEAREWWDNEGNTVWDFVVPEYEDPSLK